MEESAEAMPIIALEGPDCCGKTTLWNALQGRIEATFMPRLPVTPDLMPHMGILQRREVMLWTAMYDPKRWYVCDRHFAVTAPIYDQLYNRESEDYSMWRSELRVVYLHVPTDELKRRYEARKDECFNAKNYDKLCVAYLTNLKKYKSVVLNGTMPIEVNVSAVKEFMRT